LLAPLAQGGMGAVYLATRVDQEPPRSLVLVKTLKAGLADASDYVARFTDEMRVAVRLRHPNLCAVFEGGNEQGEFFLAMELIEGITFKRLLALLNARGERLTSTQAAALAVAMLRGLHGAHVARDENGRPLGVVHRDVSPHNAMIDVHGRVKLIDFGLATSVLKETFTESAVVLGKSAYMAPEQARGEDATVAVDEYAAGIVLYELLTQDRFYGELSSRQIWSVAGAGNHQPRLWDQVPVHLQGVLGRALSPDPRRRFPSCAALADAVLAAEPGAAAGDVLPGLGQLIRALAPDELATIARARTQLAEIEGSIGRSWVAPRPEVTEAVRRSDATGKTSEDTAATQLATRVSGEAAATRRLVLLVAAVAVVACLAAVAAVVFVVTRPPPPPPATTVVVQAPAVLPAPSPSPAIAPPPEASAPSPSPEEEKFRRDAARVHELWKVKKTGTFCAKLAPRVQLVFAVPAERPATPAERSMAESLASTLGTCR
jgi:serine/threonine-protein kinase